MTSFIQNILWNSVSGFVEAGTRTAGGYAGDALIKAGDMIENSGRNVGNGIERRATTYGSTISGQTYQSSTNPLPSTARKPALKRSNSSPAAAAPGTKKVGPTSKTPIGAKKNPGPANKQLTAVKSTVGGAQKGAGGVVGGAFKGPSGVTGSAQKTVGSTAKSASKALPKPFPNNVPYSSTVSNSKSTSALPKPYPNPSSSATEKKTAIKPGQVKPFTGGDKKNEGKTPYPGTSTLPGQGGKTPVKAKKYKPAERLAPPTEKGKVHHISV